MHGGDLVSARKVTLVVVVVALLLAAEGWLALDIKGQAGAERTEKLNLARTRAAAAAANRAVSDTKRKLSGTQQATARRVAARRQEAKLIAQSRTTLSAMNTRMASAGKILAGANASVARLRDCAHATTDSAAARRFLNPVAAVATLRNAGAACEAGLRAVDADAAVFPFDFSDPAPLRVGNVYYAYSTNASAGNVQLIASFDLAHWVIVGDALPALPSWAVPGATWAPTVTRIGSKYMMYYTVRSAVPAQCVSVASADSPAGPFVDKTKKPLVCQADRGGSVDPRVFVDAYGNATLLWKSEGAGGFTPQIWSQPLNPRGTALTGRASVLIGADRAWESGNVEAPALVAAGNELVLFYSGGQWNTSGYAVGAARCASPAGPCRKESGPVLTTHGSIAGPGSADFLRGADGTVWAFYSAYRAPHVGAPNSRLLHVARVDVSATSISFQAPNVR
jgi:hypothetical protein